MRRNEWRKVHCPSCRRAGVASIWSIDGSHYSFSCLCGLIMGGSCDQMPEDFERMAMSVSDITARVEGELSDLRQQIATLTAERDAFHAQADTAGAAVCQLTFENRALIAERDAFKLAAEEAPPTQVVLKGAELLRSLRRESLLDTAPWQRDRLLFLMAELCVTAYGDKRRSVLKAEIRKMLEEIGKPTALELP